MRGGKEEFWAATFFNKILACYLASESLPLISLCTMSAACRKDTPSRICLVYFLVKLSLRAPCCLIWSWTDACRKHELVSIRKNIQQRILSNKTLIDPSKRTGNYRSHQTPNVPFKKQTLTDAKRISVGLRHHNEIFRVKPQVCCERMKKENCWFRLGLMKYYLILWENTHTF